MAKQDYINAIAFCPELAILPETPRGNFILFLIRWITAGCSAVDISQLQMVIGIRDNVWSRYKDSVISVAEVIIPELQRIHKRVEKERRGFEKYNLNRRSNRNKQYTSTDKSIKSDVLSMRPHKSADSEPISPAPTLKAPGNPPDGWVKGW